MPDRSAAKKWDVAAAAGLATAFFGLYLRTLCRTVFWYDSAELVTAAVTLGITHPPGYPLYTWLGHAFTWLPLEPAVAVNAMSATFAAAAVALVFLVGRQLGLDRGPAAVGAATLGTGHVFWLNAVVAEVYCPALAATALISYLLLRGVQEKRRDLTLWAAFIAGLALGLHLSIATLGLGFASLVWMNGRCHKRMAAAAAATLIGSLVLLYIPLRASQDPALNICDPSTFDQFAWYVSGGAYKRWFEGGLGTLDRAGLIALRLGAQLSSAGLVLAAAGAVWLARHRPRLGLAIGLMAAGNVAVFFRYQAHDVEVFLLPTTMLLCCLVGAGSQSLTELIAKAVPPDLARYASLTAAALLFALPLWLASTNYAAADMSEFDDTEPFLRAVAETLPPDAVILTFTTPPEWRRYAVFGMYAQLVGGERTDVRHHVAPDLRKLAREIGSGPALYAYEEVALLKQFFVLEPDGPLFRVVRAKPEAASRAPRKRAESKCATFTNLEVRDAP